LIGFPAADRCLPEMSNASDLYLGHFCLEAASPEERFEAAARAGFTGISLFWNEVRSQRETSGLSRFKRSLADAQLRPVFMEYIPLPSAVEQFQSFTDEVQDIAQTSAGLNCKLLHSVALAPDTPFAVLVEGLWILTQACRDAGMNCVVEFVPFITAIPSLAEALRLLHAVNAPTLGLLADSFHFFRAGAPWSELDALERGQVLSIQVNDGPLQRPCESYGEECMTLRRLPGDGEFDLARFVRTLDRCAPEVPLMAEVVNSELLALPAVQAAGIIAEHTRKLQRLRNEFAST
jgi:sugar phosphate isomerase/epimerase